MQAFPLLFALSAALGAACSSATRVTLASSGDSPVGSFSQDGATVPIGTVVAFSASGDVVVTASIDDTTVATVTATTQTGVFVLVGVMSGQTTLRVFADNAEAYDVPVQVAPQTVP
jgi:hypothetical protein